ncbi:PEP-CTERM sorting domain-containing protein [Inhella sp.]|uniref:PEP-CTERM sorting domain-containing protein n=1 Tax=Inhella sp. TaxID=1921806 RepID=UPI0035B00BAC
MNVIKKTAVAAALALAGATSFASTINVGGVNWDPDAPTDYSGQAVNMRQKINTVTGELTGFGILTAMNGTAQGAFCPGCELTFQFGGFSPIGGQIIPGIGATVSYTGGWVKFYVDHSPEIANPANYLALTSANTGDGNLWLSLANNGVFQGTNFGNVILSGLGFLDVTGGMAAANFDTNTRPNGTDFFFSTSLTFPHSGSTVVDMSGTGNLFGSSVPEPTSLALIGLGLLGAGVVSRKRAK